MKFSALFAFAIAYATLTSAAQTNFRPANAVEAQKLQNKFKSLNANSPCNTGDEACINGQFAQCVGGKFQLTACASGTTCTVLPLVNKPGTSITCDTLSDQKARIADALGGAKNNMAAQPQPPQNGNQNPTPTPQPPQNGSNQTTNIADIRKKNAAEAKALQNKFKSLNANSPCNTGDEACINGQFAQCVGGKFQLTACAPGTTCTVLPLVNKSGTSITCDTQSDQKSRIDDALGGAKNNLAARQTPQDGNQNPTPTPQPPQNGQTTNIADIRKKNAAAAEALQNKFDKLKAGDPCNANEVACANKEFAQCVNGKLVLTPCPNDLECAALPLVLKDGTTVACTTEAERVARINQAKKNLK